MKNEQCIRSSGDHISTMTKRISYSVDEAAAITGLGRTTIYKLIAQGDLASLKIGRRRVLRATDLENFLNRLTTPSI